MSEAKDEVVELDFGIVPEAAISGPILIQNDHSAFLTFNAMREANDGDFRPAGTAIVEIARCGTTKFGYPNDEALGGHPLSSKGLEAYGIFEVLHSSWAAEQRTQNQVNFPNPNAVGNWGRHYVFTFHDSTFECLADDIKIEVSEEDYEQIFHHLADRILRGSV